MILEELRAVRTHPTAVELYEVVRKRLPRISLGTVYRNLDLLARHGLIQKVEPGSGRARFDGDASCHLHVQCVCCGQVADLCGPQFENRLAQGHKIDGHEILGLRVEYVGICSACGNQMTTDELLRLRREWEWIPDNGPGRVMS